MMMMMGIDTNVIIWMNINVDMYVIRITRTMK